MRRSIDVRDYNKYIPTEGGLEVLEEIVKLENRRLPSGAPKYDISNVMIVPGGIQAFSLLTEALIKPGEKVLVPIPGYFSLTALCEERYKVEVVASVNLNFRAQDYRAHFSDQIRMAWLCNPNNPTGLFVPTVELDGIIDCCRTNSAFLILDESCDNFIYERPYEYPQSISFDHVARIRTFSKDPNLAGYRLGYILGSREVLEKAKRIAPILYGNPCVMALRAICEELRIKNGSVADRDYSDRTGQNFRLLSEARTFLYQRLINNPSVLQVVMPEACYYMFAKLAFKAGSEAFSRELLHNRLLDVVPGTVFGMPDRECWIRMCFARNHAFLEQALDKIDAVLRS